jgi:DNA-binding beta-propeller fold protein YncE
MNDRTARAMVVALIVCCACKHDKPTPKPAPVTPSTSPLNTPPSPIARVSRIALPDTGSNGVALDYLTFDPHTNTVWVPIADTGSVDVVDTATRKVHAIEGFPTRDAESDGTTRRLGPSSVTTGDGIVYVGDRADNSICAIDENTLSRGKCTTLNEAPDSLLYDSSTRQVWVTTPRDNSIRILDASSLAQTARIELPGAPEGFAIDVQNARYYTNLEDRDATEVIDTNSHAIVATWNPNCGEAGPRSLRVDSDTGLLFVACTSKVESLSLHSGGQIVGSVAAGEGVDDFDYAPGSHLLFIGAENAGKLTVASVAGDGTITVKDVIPTIVGARNGVVDAAGIVYLAHGGASELLAVDTRSR